MSNTTALSSRRTLLLAAAATLALGSAPTRAEENRLLPFWGQPFPYGYTRREVTYPAPYLADPGAAPRRCRGVPHARRAGPCPAVLHARD